MPVEWLEIDQEVLSIAQSVMEEHEPELLNARIGFIFRSEAPKQNGRVILGKAQKVSDKDKFFSQLDFVIWLAEDKWLELSPFQKRALVHHELLHCKYQDGECRMRPHDFEEFVRIVKLYGFWSLSLQSAAPIFEQALQMRMGFSEEISKRLGALVALKPDVVLTTVLAEE